jgi:hypothetical protein
MCTWYPPANTEVYRTCPQCGHIAALHKRMTTADEYRNPGACDLCTLSQIAQQLGHTAAALAVYTGLTPAEIGELGGVSEELTGWCRGTHRQCDGMLRSASGYHWWCACPCHEDIPEPKAGTNDHYAWLVWRDARHEQANQEPDEHDFSSRTRRRRQRHNQT